jgi:hypothetical protein
MFESKYSQEYSDLRESDRTIEETDYFLFSLANVIGAVIVTRLMIDASRFLFRQGQETFFFPSQLYIGSGVHLTSSVVAGESVPGVRRLRLKVEHPSPTSRMHYLRPSIFLCGVLLY